MKRKKTLLEKAESEFISADIARDFTLKSSYLIEEISAIISVAAAQNFSTIEYPIEGVDEVVIDRLQELLMQKKFHFTLVSASSKSKKPQSIIISW